VKLSPDYYNGVLQHTAFSPINQISISLFYCRIPCTSSLKRTPNRPPSVFSSS